MPTPFRHAPQLNKKNENKNCFNHSWPVLTIPIKLFQTPLKASRKTVQIPFNLIYLFLFLMYSRKL